MPAQDAGLTLIAVPALNERATVAQVIGAVRAHLPAAQIVVIDDGSSDGTAEVARAAGATTLSLPFNVGVGGAMRLAFRYAQSVGATAVVQVDGDGQHDASHIEDLLSALQEASVVVGCRFGDQSPEWVGGSRRLAMRALARLLSRITGTRLDDVTSGFRAADAAAIELFARDYPTEYLGDTVESLVLASRAGLTITQVPVTMHPRQGGAPSQNPLRSAWFLGRAVMAVGVALTRPVHVRDGS